MIFDLSLIPIGIGTSVWEYLVEAIEIIRESGMKYESHSMGTNIEGE